jgi:hypothetical protein
MATYASSISMLNNEDLETVVLGVNTPSTILGAFTGFKIDVVIPAENPFMVMDEFGVIYDPNYQTIIYVSGKTKDLTGYTIPSTVTAFADSSFSGVKMDKLIIPEGVIRIGEYAFEDADIPYISFPASLEVIDSFCFGGCTVKEIVFADEHNSKLSFLGELGQSGQNLVVHRTGAVIEIHALSHGNAVILHALSAVFTGHFLGEIDALNLLKLLIRSQLVHILPIDHSKILPDAL